MKIPTGIVHNIYDIYDERKVRSHMDTDSVGYRSLQHIEFPKPTGINVNMMPIDMYDAKSIPDNLKQYNTMIWFSCRYRKVNFFDINRIVYLTVHEELIPVGSSQRRPGVHIEQPNNILSGGNIITDQNSETYRSLAWGLGCWGIDEIPVDGIVMATNTERSCRIWDMTIKNPQDLTDKHGGLENCKKYFGDGDYLPANNLVWFTDRTPHESLPLEAPKDDPKATHVYRQFFRVVIGDISVWFSKHNTPNPTGTLPNAPIVDVDKFAT